VSAFRLLVKNSAANIAAGAANALLAVVLPPVLVRHLTSAEFSTWSVVLQLAAVVYVFQFGVQVAVGRYVAYCTARGDTDFRRQIVSTAFAAMWFAALLALVVIVAMSTTLPLLFPGMPDALHREARIALVAIGASLALGLPASVAAGVYSGLQRNDVPAIFVVASRIIVAVALFALASHGFGLLPMAIAYASTIGGTALLQLAVIGARHPEFAFQRAAVTRRAGRELAGYCFSLTIWSVGILVISGLDAVIAGALNFSWAGYFGIAASAVTLIVGMQSAMLQPLIAIAAHLHSRGEKRQLGMLLTDASRINTLVFLAAIAPFFVAGEWLTRLWVGDVMAQHVLPIVQVLLLGVLLRQTLAPFAIILLGTGEQRLVIWTPAYEAVAKLASSIGLGVWLGPVGVALGTVVGAIVCLATNLTLVFPRVRGFTMPRWTFFRHDIATPTLAFVPILVLPLLNVQPTMSTVLALQATVVALVMVAAAAMAFASLRRLRALI
jgi:O-antigen/teichoic acid export membrane protein